MHPLYTKCKKYTPQFGVSSYTRCKKYTPQLGVASHTRCKKYTRCSLSHLVQFRAEGGGES